MALTPEAPSRRKTLGSTSIIVIITVVLILAVVGRIVWGHFRHRREQEIQRNYSQCYHSLCIIEKALQEYARDHRGLYPDKLDRLVPRYLKEFPLCPQARRNTYKASYYAITLPPMYFLACQGTNHLGPPDTPQIVSDLGFFSEKASDPLVCVYEEGHMREIMELIQESNGLIKKGKCDGALGVLRREMKLRREKRDEMYVKMAYCSFSLGDDRSALSSLEEALKVRFDLSQWMVLAPWLYQEKNQEPVLRMMKRYYRENPQDISAALVVSKLLEARGESAEAQRLYKGVLDEAMSGNPAVDLYFRGLLLRSEGSNQDALDTLMSIRDVQTQNLPAEQFACLEAEEYIKELKEKVKDRKEEAPPRKAGK
ncbi:MAG: hypothetical protein RDV48_08795 [Candidatus Eremiobacteraeota bacterium]|nr:hypothetical protein [Candidatus Eremiobacteraeota bacterium]